jgi:hypothetical protein
LEELIKRIVALIPDNPVLVDMSVDSLHALRQVGITWEELNTVTRGQMIDARTQAVKRWNREAYLIRVKFGFSEATYDALVRMGIELGVKESEVVRRALQLYVSLHKELKDKDQVTVTKEHLK